MFTIPFLKLILLISDNYYRPLCIFYHIMLLTIRHTRFVNHSFYLCGFSFALLGTLVVIINTIRIHVPVHTNRTLLNCIKLQKLFVNCFTIHETLVNIKY